jgi:hypothetical protein
VENRFAYSEGGKCMQDVTNWRDAGRTATDQDGAMQVNCHRQGQIDYLCSHISNVGEDIFLIKHFLVNTKTQMADMQEAPHIKMENLDTSITEGIMQLIMSMQFTLYVE